MEVTDASLVCNRDWDPSYLSSIFDVDFHDSGNISDNSISDMELVRHVESVERYSPLVEDISLDDDTLCQAVDQIERE